MINLSKPPTKCFVRDKNFQYTIGPFNVRAPQLSITFNQFTKIGPINFFTATHCGMSCV